MIKVEAKTVKSFSTEKFDVALLELPNGRYVVAYQTLLSDGPIIGEPVADYHNASFLYDIKIKELEGH